MGLKKEDYIKKAEGLLTELEENKSSLIYLCELEKSGQLSGRELDGLRRRISHLTRTVSAVEHTLSHLPAVERSVLTGLYVEKGNDFYDVCEECSLERSSVYRYRRMGLERMAKKMWGR